MHTETSVTTPIELIGPYAEELLLRRMTAVEGLGRLFKLQLEVLSLSDDLELDQFIGKDLTVRLELSEDSEEPNRYFHGHVSRFSYAGTLGRYSVYNVTLRPWLWFLTRTADCRIFQEMTVPAILMKVFEDSHRFSPDMVDGLDSATYRTWDYCVQYRETDFDFVSRLMEQEGIYYYFRHEFKDGKGAHTLVLADSYAAHELATGYEAVPFLAAPRTDTEEKEAVHEWSVAQQFEPMRYVLRDFDFTNPPMRAAAEALEAWKGDENTYEIYDYPGILTGSEDAEHYAQVRLEELEARQEQIRARSTARGLGAGHLFTLKGHSRSDQNREYLIVSAVHVLGPIEYETVRETVPYRTYSSTLTAIDSRHTYRSPTATPKPVVQGPQTAFVVGPEGHDIWTDKYGRVMVMFHWDRYGKPDEKSSCWIRVAQTWAGKSWGTLFVPRIGQEVIVELLDGDPDRPIITGQVYNEVSRPPYDPSEQGTMTTLKSLSSLGGEGFNEIRFED
ncbi:MAG: type VI secretion system Vgr family protein, partial [Planctomycetota bacterium]